jgi:hypothetical protein
VEESRISFDREHRIRQVKVVTTLLLFINNTKTHSFEVYCVIIVHICNAFVYISVEY